MKKRCVLAGVTAARAGRGAMAHEGGLCSLPGLLQKNHGSSGRTGTEQLVGILQSLQHSLQGPGGAERQRWFAKSKDFRTHQVTYGDALMTEFLGDQAFTILGKVSC